MPDVPGSLSWKPAVKVLVTFGKSIEATMLELHMNLTHDLLTSSTLKRGFSKKKPRAFAQENFHKGVCHFAVRCLLWLKIYRWLEKKTE